MYQTIMVTGGTGFIGRHLVNELLKGDNRHVICVSREMWDYADKGRTNLERNTSFSHLRVNLSNPAGVVALMQTYHPQVIYHLAGNPNVKLDKDDPRGESLWATNVDGTRNLLESAPDGCLFALASSATVYGECFDLCAAQEEDPPSPTSLYALSKWASEELVNLYTRMGRIRGVNLRYVANVGTGSTHGLLHDIVKKLYGQSPSLNLLGSAPGSIKPYMHVSDTVGATLHLTRNGEAPEHSTYNVAAIQPLSVETIAHMAMNVTGIQKPIVWLGDEANWKGDNRIVKVYTGKLQKTYWPKYPTSSQAVEQALKEIVSCRKPA